MHLPDLYQLVKDRKCNPQQDSYTSQLFSSGPDRIIQKCGEEAIEVVIAAKNEDKERLVSELADLHYHLTVLMVAKNISWSDIEHELAQRHQKSQK